MITSKIIHAELRDGSYRRYLWLGNDYFASLYDSWDFETNHGKYYGMVEFDEKFSYTFDCDELHLEEIIGMNVEEVFDWEDADDADIVDYELEEFAWLQSKILSSKEVAGGTHRALLNGQNTYFGICPEQTTSLMSTGLGVQND